ncbi:nuclear transport factor 2 family protein [Microbacteriaceae bacterium VKM Ac-2855]|nr:nuclear transport factor 2 family protein [Microbacteriaceae bacterium VKM Ac-2855]
MNAIEQEILTLSRDKWRWMSSQDADRLVGLFHPEAVFVHMGGTFSAAEELDVIRSGRIHYLDIDITAESVRIVGATAFVLSTLKLGAVVEGNTVTNPFVVTEVYVVDGAWRLASMAFTRRIDGVD